MMEEHEKNNRAPDNLKLKRGRCYELKLVKCLGGCAGAIIQLVLTACFILVIEFLHLDPE